MWDIRIVVVMKRESRSKDALPLGVLGPADWGVFRRFAVTLAGVVVLM